MPSQNLKIDVTINSDTTKLIRNVWRNHKEHAIERILQLKAADLYLRNMGCRGVHPGNQYIRSIRRKKRIGEFSEDYRDRLLGMSPDFRTSEQMQKQRFINKGKVDMLKETYGITEKEIWKYAKKKK